MAEHIGGRNASIDYRVHPKEGYYIHDQDLPPLPLEHGSSESALLFKKRILMDKKSGKIKVEYVHAGEFGRLKPERFCDFKFVGKVDRQSLLSVFEGVIEGRQKPSWIGGINWAEEIHPQTLARDYVHATQAIE